MASYHDISTRGQQTGGVWSYFAPTLTFGALALAPFQAEVAAMPAADQAVVNAEAGIDEKRDLRDAKVALVRELATRLPRLAANSLAPEDSLQDNIAQTQGIEMQSEELIFDRGQATLMIWTETNIRLAAATPPLPALTLPKVGGGTWAVADLAAALTAVPVLKQQVANAAGPLSDKRSARRALAARVDRANKRWYEAWGAHFPEGTPEHDALSQISTEGGGGSTPPPPPPPPPPPLALPTAPQNPGITSGATGSGTLTFTWDAAPTAQEVTTYNVYGETGLQASPTTNSVELDSFDPGSSVTLTVKAANATGEGPASEPATGTAG